MFRKTILASIMLVLAMQQPAVCRDASTQDISPKVQMIIRQTVAADGFLTEQMHREFWREVNQLGTPSEAEQAKRLLNSHLLMAQEYQKEVWGSAKISYESGRVVKTQRLRQLEVEMPLDFEASLPFPKNSENYRQAVGSYKKGNAVSMENSKRLLVAAAKHTELTSVQGQVTPVDMQLIETEPVPEICTGR